MSALPASIARCAAALGALACLSGLSAEPDADRGFKARLHETGLYAADAGDAVHPQVVSFAPQYPLWSDGTDKRRWMRLPAGRSVDASTLDAWSFPVGTRFWKQFSVGGRPVETRFIERRADGRWHFATYVWNDEGTDARLAPARGFKQLPVAAAPDGRYVVPSRTDCLACHRGTKVPVLGFTALQLSPARDPNAANGRPLRDDELDLRALAERGLVRGLPASVFTQPPQIEGDTPIERAALGYLHGNCAHCHNTSGRQAPVSLTLAQSAGDPHASRTEVLNTLLETETRYRPATGEPHSQYVVPGNAAASVLAQRIESTQALTRMPPLGTRVPDPEGVALVHRWINQELPKKRALQP